MLASTALPASAGMADAVKHFHMYSQNGSGQSGTVTLLGEAGGSTIIRVRVANPGPDPEPAHVHVGPCSKLNPKPTYALAPLIDGISQTTIPQPIDALVAHGFAVNVHKSAKEASIYVSCGDLT
jgi:hypothetical protein